MKIIHPSNALLPALLRACCLLGVAMGPQGIAEPEAAADRSLAWDQTPGMLALKNQDRTVWQFNLQSPGGKSCFHPLGLLDGTSLTWYRPPDHPWHRALWFSWKFINQGNYWEEDRKSEKSEGVSELMESRIDARDDFSARIDQLIAYHAEGQPPLLTEQRRIHVSRPDESGSYVIRWRSTFLAIADKVELDRTPIEGQPGGKSWGGYAGLSLRLASDLSEWRVIDSEGRKGLEASAQRSQWLDYSGKLPGGKWAGIAVFDHPTNLRYPSPWYVIMNPEEPFAYFSPAVLYFDPYMLRKGEQLTLKYQILVHEGLLEPAHLRKYCERFAQ